MLNKKNADEISTEKKREQALTDLLYEAITSAASLYIADCDSLAGHTLLRALGVAEDLYGRTSPRAAALEDAIRRAEEIGMDDCLPERGEGWYCTIHLLQKHPDVSPPPCFTDLFNSVAEAITALDTREPMAARDLLATAQRRALNTYLTGLDRAQSTSL